MPPTNDPQGGIQEFWARINQLATRLTNLETWQRTPRTASGTVIFTFSSSDASATQTVDHGLAGVPRVFLQNAGFVGFDSLVTAVNDTTFTAEAFTTTETGTSGTVQFYWWATL